MIPNSDNRGLQALCSTARLSQIRTTLLIPGDFIEYRTEQNGRNREILSRWILQDPFAPWKTSSKLMKVINTKFHKIHKGNKMEWVSKASSWSSYWWTVCQQQYDEIHQTLCNTHGTPPLPPRFLPVLGWKGKMEPKTGTGIGSTWHSSGLPLLYYHEGKQIKFKSNKK